MIYGLSEKDTHTTDGPPLWNDRKPNLPFCAERVGAELMTVPEGRGKGMISVNLLAFLSTETVQYVSVNR